MSEVFAQTFRKKVKSAFEFSRNLAKKPVLVFDISVLFGKNDTLVGSEPDRASWVRINLIATNSLFRYVHYYKKVDL